MIALPDDVDFLRALDEEDRLGGGQQLRRRAAGPAARLRLEAAPAFVHEVVVLADSFGRPALEDRIVRIADALGSLDVVIVVTDIRELRIVPDGAGAGLRLDEIGFALADPALTGEHEIGDRLRLLRRADGGCAHDERGGQRNASHQDHPRHRQLSSVQAQAPGSAPERLILPNRIAQDPIGRRRGRSKLRQRGRAQKSGVEAVGIGPILWSKWSPLFSAQTVSTMGPLSIRR